MSDEQGRAPVSDEETLENLPEQPSQAKRTQTIEDAEARLEALERAELSVDAAFATGKAERSRITRVAQLDAAEAVAMAGIAMESDEVADEAFRFNVIASHSGDPEAAKRARKRMRDANREAKANHRAATRSAKQAYDAIRFSAPNTLGFMRAVQVLFAVQIFLTLLQLLLTNRDMMVYDTSSYLSWAMVILEGVAFWFFINRYKIARPFVIGIGIVGIAVIGIEQIMTGFNIWAFLASVPFYVFLILYFALSKRVKATMVNDLARRTGIYDKEGTAYLERGWPLIRNLIIYFIVFSVLGHWMEAGMCQFIRLGLVEGEYDPTNTMLWRDWLYPFPMEGAAVVIIALFLYPLLQWLKKVIKVPILPYVVSFFANALVCSCIEFSMGLLVNANHQLWDYSTMPFNIMGQVCLQNAMAFGAASSIIAWWVYPLLQLWLARVPDAVMNIAFVVIAAIGGILWSLYLFDPPEVIEYVPEAQYSQEQSDAQSMEVGVDLLQASLDALEGTVEGSQTLPKDEFADDLQMIQEGIDALEASLTESGVQVLADEAPAPAAAAALNS